MALQGILTRYADYGLLIYGGDQDFIDMLSQTSTIVSWINENGGTVPLPQVVPTQLVQIIVTTTGYVDGVRVETMAASYLESAAAIIYHGYPEFKVQGLNVMKETYTGGCLITPLRGEPYRLQKISEVLGHNVTIPSPFQYTPDMDRLLPYVHIYTRIEDTKYTEQIVRIPIREIPPTSIGTHESIDAIYSSSVFVDKDRKLLLAAIDLAIRAPANFILLYYGDLYIRWLPQFLDLFLLSKGVEVHLWGKDQGVELPQSSAVRVRPEGLGTGITPDLDAYIREYGDSPNIVILADDDGVDLLRLNPIAAYIPYANDVPGIPTVTPWTTLGRANLLYLRGNTRTTNVSQANINAFHYNDRTSSYNIGAVIDRVLGTPSGVGRSLSMPDVGLCTCYDCASEVSIMTRYMMNTGIPFDIETLSGLIRYNGPSLWPISRPISRPQERKNLLISPDEIDRILDLDMYAYNNIGIGVTQEILDTNPNYMGEDLAPMERMRKVLEGRRFPLVVNFHRLGVRNYNPDTDKGRTGERRYKKFLQDVALSTSNNLDIWGVLTLFILAESR